MTAAEPEDGKRSERNDQHLCEAEGKWRRPHQPQRREEGQERIDMPAEPNDLVARRPERDLERMSVRRAPDRLHHVPEVEAAFAEGHVAASHDPEENDAPSRHRDPDGDGPAMLARPRGRVDACRPVHLRHRGRHHARTAAGTRTISGPPRDSRTASETVTNAIVSVHAVWNGVG